MGVIEAAWRAREAQRQCEIKAMKAKYSDLEKQTRELLTATQERERALLAAEAELRLRKAGLEREAAARMSEAEAAVRRLQVGDESVEAQPLSIHVHIQASMRISTRNDRRQRMVDCFVLSSTSKAVCWGAPSPEPPTVAQTFWSGACLRMVLFRLSVSTS
jgi:hypothetical protein